jgi:hypothetical protein
MLPVSSNLTSTATIGRLTSQGAGTASKAVGAMKNGLGIKTTSLPPNWLMTHIQVIKPLYDRYMSHYEKNFLTHSL